MGVDVERWRGFEVRPLADDDEDEEETDEADAAVDDDE